MWRRDGAYILSHFLCHQGTKHAAPPLDLRETKLQNADRRKPLAITASAAARSDEDDEQGNNGVEDGSDAALEVVEGVKSAFFAEPPPPLTAAGTRRTARSGASTRRRVRLATDLCPASSSQRFPCENGRVVAHALCLER